MKAPNAYVSRPSGDDPRSTEAWALGEASRRLALAAKMTDKGEALREALRLNQRLWSIFQAALSEPDCPLPKDVRAWRCTIAAPASAAPMAASAISCPVTGRCGDMEGV